MKLLEKIGFLPATIIGFCSVLWLSGCGKNDCREDEGQAKLENPVKIIRLEDSIMALQDTHQTRLFLDRNPLFSEKFLRRSEMPHDSFLVKDVFKLTEETLVDTVYQDVKKEFGNLSWLENDLTQFYGRVKHYYPQFYVPPVYSLVTGYGVDLEVKDSVLFIGLEYFLSDSARYKAPQIPEYIQRRLKKRFLVPSIAMVVADGFTQIDILDNTMMGEMVKWGRIYYFMEKTMPCLQDSILSGYTEVELKEVNENLKTIWAHYLDKKLFFNTDLFLIKKYCDERPKINEIGDACPGRIGRWLGWQIVRKWAKEKNKTLQQVMAEKNARRIFQESGFKP
jgi:hypothetical protein